MGYRVIQSALRLKPYQQLLFSTYTYGVMRQLWGDGTIDIAAVRRENLHVLLLSGIGNPQQMEQDVRRFAKHVKSLTFSDHHYYRKRDAAALERAFKAMQSPRIVITTEKDATRLRHLKGLGEDVRRSVYVLPVTATILRGESDKFNQTILDYVQQNKADSGVAP